MQSMIWLMRLARWLHVLLAALLALGLLFLVTGAALWLLLFAGRLGDSAAGALIAVVAAVLLAIPGLVVLHFGASVRAALTLPAEARRRGAGAIVDIPDVSRIRRGAGGASYLAGWGLRQLFPLRGSPRLLLRPPYLALAGLAVVAGWFVTLAALVIGVLRLF